jgi:hypothetical protein
MRPADTLHAPEAPSTAKEWTEQAGFQFMVSF